MPITSHQQEPADWNAVVAANLRGQLGLLGWTQAQLATALGMNEMWISRRLKGGAKLTPDELMMFAEFFDVPIANLFNTKKAPTPKGEGQREEPSRISVKAHRFGNVTELPLSAVEAVDREELAPIHTLRRAS